MKGGMKMASSLLAHLYSRIKGSQEDVATLLDRAASNSIDNRIRNAENCAVAEAGSNRRTAVDAG